MLSEGLHKGMEVQVVRSDGRPFTEHKIEHQSPQSGHPTTTTCWLEVEQDTTFIIKIKLHPSSQLLAYHSGAWRMKTSIDGKLVDSMIHSENGPVLRTYDVSAMVYRLNQQHMLGELKFTRLRTTDLVRGSEGRPDADAGATIQVDLQAGTMGDVTSIDIPDHSADSPNGDVVQEREAKKTGTSVSAVNGKPAPKLTYYDWTPLDQQQPYHRFIFKYRTRPVLEILKVIGREQSPPPVPRDDRKRKRIPDDSYTSGGVQKEMLQAMLDMRREMTGLRRTVARLENQRERSRVIDLVDSDSD